LGSVLSAILGAVFLFAVYAFVDLTSSLFFNSKQSGWFYRVIGPVAKAVDSNKIAPYDSCLVPGPLDSKGFTSRLCSQNIPFAIVDVNSVFGAEVVECCPQLDKKWIEGALSDNPAGNDESMTPIVLLWEQERVKSKGDKT